MPALFALLAAVACNAAAKSLAALALSSWIF